MPCALARPRAHSCRHAQLRPHRVKPVTRLEHVQSHTIGAAGPIYFASHRQTKFLGKTLRSPEPLHRHLDRNRRRLPRPNRNAIHIPLRVRIPHPAEHKHDNRRHHDSLNDRYSARLFRFAANHTVLFDPIHQPLHSMSRLRVPSRFHLSRFHRDRGLRAARRSQTPCGYSPPTSDPPTPPRSPGDPIAGITRSRHGAFAPFGRRGHPGCRPGPHPNTRNRPST